MKEMRFDDDSVQIAGGSTRIGGRCWLRVVSGVWVCLNGGDKEVDRHRRFE